jgi:hypothetical protein
MATRLERLWAGVKQFLGLGEREPQGDRDSWGPADWEASGQLAHGQAVHEERMGRNKAEIGLDLAEAEGIAKHEEARDRLIMGKVFEAGLHPLDVQPVFEAIEDKLAARYVYWWEGPEILVRDCCGPKNPCESGQLECSPFAEIPTESKRHIVNNEVDWGTAEWHGYEGRQPFTLKQVERISQNVIDGKPQEEWLDGVIPADREHSPKMTLDDLRRRAEEICRGGRERVPESDRDHDHDMER